MSVGKWWGIGVCVGDANTVYMAGDSQRRHMHGVDGLTGHGGGRLRVVTRHVTGRV